jgi:hypothetical protein
MKVKALDQQKQNISTLIPRHPFSMSIIGAKSSGKSSLLINLLKQQDGLKGVFNRVILISPTCTMDDKIQDLINTPILKRNNTLDKALKKQLKVKNIMDKDFQEIHADEYINSADVFEELTPQFLNDLMEHQKNVIEEFGKSSSDKVLLVLDDSIQNKFLHSRQFINFVLLSRHVNISLILISQAYFLVPKSIRLNCSCLVLFEISNNKELDAIFDENFIGISRGKFMEIYNKVMEVPFNFLTILHQNERGKKLLRCMESFIK